MDTWLSNCGHLRKRWGRQNTSTANIGTALALVNNRVGLTPDLMDQLKNDIMDVVATYFEGDQDTTEFNDERSDEPMALVSNIGVKRVRRRWDDDTDPTLAE